MAVRLAWPPRWRILVRRERAPVSEAARVAKEYLDSAGAALEPDQPGGPDLVRAVALLGQALIAVSPVIARTGARGALLLELQRGELFVAKLVEDASGRRALKWAELRVKIAVAAVGLAALAALVGPPIAYRLSSDGLRFRASGAIEPFAVTGEVGKQPAYDLFFHTPEQQDPWVEIELGGLKKVKRVTVVNREDCCTEREVPLIVELRDAEGRHHEVARQNEDFDRWTAQFPSQDATAVKLWVPRMTAFHLTNVQIR